MRAFRPIETIGFVGLGVMGEPMCRNLARRLAETGAERLIVFDVRAEPVERLAADGAAVAPSLDALVATADVVCLSLPGGPEVEDVVTRPGGILDNARDGTIVLDLSTTPVELTRKLAERLGERGLSLVDAPVARTRQAAEDGTLAIMVGGDDEAVRAVWPILTTMASDIAHCGGHGAGQMVKILNNMVLFQTVHALAEALAVARRAGLDGKVLFDALSNGSADSFAVRNHGMKALLPGDFPERAFPVTYAAKDLSYALDLANSVGLSLAGADAVRAAFHAAEAAGDGARYWPVIGRTIDDAGPNARDRCATTTRTTGEEAR